MKQTALILAAILVLGGLSAAAEESAEELAKKLSNPISSLVSLPLQFNYDQDFGVDDDGDKLFVNVQPVLPFSMTENWNLISRTILPVIRQSDVPSGSGDERGIGDIVQSLFFSPKQPTKGGLVWGVGPVLLFPTGSDDRLTGEKWGAGPTAVALKQSGGLTYGGLVNHIESFAGKDERADVSATFMQPFLALTTKKAWTYTLNSESTYDWETEEWSIPINGLVSKLMTWGKQRVQLGAGLRYWADAPDGGPEGLGARVQLTLLYPK
ncbi:MAG: transporter [bacterium]|nr:transporter [bacterium]